MYDASGGRSDARNSRGSAPARRKVSSSDELASLAFRNITVKLKNAPIQWHAAKAQLAVQFEERFLIGRG